MDNQWVFDHADMWHMNKDGVVFQFVVQYNADGVACITKEMLEDLLQAYGCYKYEENIDVTG